MEGQISFPGLYCRGNIKFSCEPSSLNLRLGETVAAGVMDGLVVDLGSDVAGEAKYKLSLSPMLAADNLEAGTVRIVCDGRVENAST
jgi:hypothetical protein